MRSRSDSLFSRILSETRKRFPNAPEALVATNRKLLFHAFVQKAAPETSASALVPYVNSVIEGNLDKLSEYAYLGKFHKRAREWDLLAYRSVRAACDTFKGKAVKDVDPKHVLFYPMSDGEPDDGAERVCTVKTALKHLHADLAMLHGSPMHRDTLKQQVERYFDERFARCAHSPPFHHSIVLYRVFQHESWVPFRRFNDEYKLIPPEQVDAVGALLTGKLAEYSEHKAAIDFVAATQDWLLDNSDDNSVDWD